MKKMTKSDAKRAMKLLNELRESIARDPSPIFKMSKEDVIKQLRKTRKELWEKKLAARH